MRQPHLRRYLVSGLLTLIPLWVTWVVVEFIFRQLSNFGRPWVRVLAGRLEQTLPSLSEALLNSWFQSFLAVLFTLVVLYALGFMVNQVVGRRIINAFESFVARVPGVQTVYGSVRKLVASLQQKPDGVQRVVLIEFPSPEMKAVGFVTRTFVAADSGRELAAVYVPTTPNPTSGYLEIVPVERLVSTAWSVDEAMNFIISGGAVAPASVSYDQPVKPPPSES